MLHSLSIAKKIWLSLSILVLVYSAMMIGGFAVGQKRIARLQGVSEYLFPASQQSQLALATFKEQTKLYEDAIMLGDDSLIESAQLKASEVKKALQVVADLPGIDAKKMDEVKETLREFDDFTASAKAIYTAMSSRLTLSFSEKLEGPSYVDVTVKLAEQTQDLQKKLTSFTQTFADELKAELADISRTTKNYWNMNMLAFLVVVFGTLFLIAIFIIRSITRPIKGVIKGVTGSTSQVSSASAQISRASQRLAEGTNEQASGLEESSSSLEEMSVMTKQNADNARQANTLAVGTRESAERGMETMQRMSMAIEDIKKSSDETAKIIKTIDEIAFQTNLLALNAAVEAARAGESGKGFAVVAEEVRNLAQRSAEAARNTTSLIEKSKNNSDSGVKVSQEVGTILEEIVGSARKVTDLVGEVASASEEQAKGIDQVNDAVAQMNKITQESASNAEESASASQELNAQGVQLSNMIAELVALVDGASKNNLIGGSTIKAPGGHKQVKYKGPGESIHGVDHEGENQSKEIKTPYSTRTDAKVVKPEEIIPLDDGDFKDF